jgi:hypothetical protein
MLFTRAPFIWLLLKIYGIDESLRKIWLQQKFLVVKIRQKWLLTFNRHFAWFIRYSQLRKITGLSSQCVVKLKHKRRNEQPTRNDNCLRDRESEKNISRNLSFLVSFSIFHSLSLFFSFSHFSYDCCFTHSFSFQFASSFFFHRLLLNGDTNRV